MNVDILTMSNRELRGWVRYLNSTALWGRSWGRQFGSPEDLRLAETERRNYQQLVAGLRVFAQMVDRLMPTVEERAATFTRLAQAVRRLGQR